MTYKRYPSYKQTAFEWLGQVPTHWTPIPIKYLAEFFGGGTPSKEKPDYWGGDIPWVSPKDMKVDFIVDTEDYVTEAGLQNSPISLISPGAVLLVVRSGILKHTIPVAQNLVPVTLNQDMKALKFSSAVDARFFVRWVQGLNDHLLKEWSKQGATVESIEHSYLAGLVMFLPPKEEQSAVVQFLEKEVTKIDTLIAKQQKLIELLKEKRLAVISHAVTKGLDPTIPMKPSGVEWLGDVPEHWAVRKVKWSFSTTSGSTPNTSEQDLYYNGSIPWIRSLDLNDGMISSYEIAITEQAHFDTACKVLPVGTVLLAMYGGDGTIGKNGLLAIPAATNQALCALLPCEVFHSRFTLYFMQHYRPYWMVGAEGTRKDPNISQERVRDATILVPPLEEQKNIADYIEAVTSKIDRLIEKAETAITLQEEHRRALISAAVTGKFDVRGAMPDLQEAA